MPMKMHTLISFMYSHVKSHPKSKFHRSFRNLEPTTWNYCYCQSSCSASSLPVSLLRVRVQAGVHSGSPVGKTNAVTDEPGWDALRRNGSVANLRNYGQTCDDQLQCSTKMGLQCESGICQCSNSTTFSQVQKQCVGRVGQACVKSKCSDYAGCILRTNKCQCIQGHFLDWEDKCSPKLGLFGNCTTDDQCSDNLPLKCTDGMCNCNGNISVLYKGPKVGDEYPNAGCVGRANAPCILSRCVPGASCHTDYLFAGAQVQRDLVPNYPVKKRSAVAKVAWWTTAQLDDYGYNPSSSEESDLPMQGLFPGHTLIPVQAKIPTLQQVCLCDEGYTYSKSGTCGKAFGAPCIKDECVDGLVCKGNHCSCRYPHQQFSGLTLSCRSKIRGPCAVNEDCIDNTICRLYGNRTYGECSCREGYIENMRRECDVHHGGDCIKNSDCDSIAGLVCMEGKCECGGFAEFSKVERKCLSLAVVSVMRAFMSPLSILVGGMILTIRVWEESIFLNKIKWLLKIYSVDFKRAESR
ncbi:unnamed protein product, partial [Allacma fusca]